MATSPRLELTTQATVSVKLDLQLRRMLKARCEENATLQAQKLEIEARQERLKLECEDILRKAGQAGALMDGVEIDGHRLKMVCGQSSKFDKTGFMKRHGLGAADFDAFTEKVPKKPYLKVTPPGSTDRGDD